MKKHIKKIIRFSIFGILSFVAVDELLRIKNQIQRDKKTRKFNFHRKMGDIL